MRAVVLAAVLALVAGPAWAQTDLFSRQTVSGLIDLRAAAADGEAAWTDGGYGKLRYGGSRGTLEVAEAHLVWQPRLSWTWQAVIDATYQPGQDRGIDLGEAYLAWRSAPGRTRYSARLGLMYPPVSLEHEGAAWTVAESITPSAINSWIGEEVKVVGAEVTARRTFGGHELAITGAVFGYNDTAGSLLSIRGWALHDLKATAYSDFPLPPMSAFLTPRQAPHTDPVFEIDRRAGYYGRLDWRPPAPVALNAVYYDNAGDRIGVRDKQWAWETRFIDLGAVWTLDERTRLTAQAMNGETLMGFRSAGGIWIDVGFTSAYLMATRDVGKGDAISVRLDGFSIRDRTNKALDDNAEEGWAAMAAWRHPVSDHATLLIEAIHVDSDRPARLYMGAAPGQSQSALQSALRISF